MMDEWQGMNRRTEGRKEGRKAQNGWRDTKERGSREGVISKKEGRRYTKGMIVRGGGGRKEQRKQRSKTTSRR